MLDNTEVFLFYFRNPFFFILIPFLFILFFARYNKLNRILLIVMYNIVFFFLIISIFDSILACKYIPPDVNIRTSNSYYHHGLKENKIEQQDWENKYQIITNSLGFKDRSTRKVNLRNNSYRIIFIGDSFTEGIGIPYDKTFVGLIDSKLREKNIDVLNASVISYSPRLYYLKIKYFIEMGLKFNELFVCLDISDIQDEIMYSDFVPWRTTPVDKISIYFYQHSIFFRFAYMWFKKKLNHNANNLEINNIQLLKNEFIQDQINYYNVRSKWLYDKTIYKKWGGIGIKLAIQNMNFLHKLCQSSGIVLNLVVYPWPEQIKRRDYHSKWVAIWKSYAKKRKINFINLFPLFINLDDKNDVIRKYYIKNDVHWNEQGHRLISEYFIPVLKKCKNYGRLEYVK